MHSLIEALRDIKLYDHPTAGIEVLETHISWVLLTGPFAYKIKKPVAFSFVDFSTLAKRRYCCEEEVRLNRRFAPDLYLGVLPITEYQGSVAWNGRGRVIEYAVKMRQFPQQNLVNNLADTRRLSATHIDQIADLVAKIHSDAPRAQAHSAYGEAQRIKRRTADNFLTIQPYLPEPKDRELLDRIFAWSEQQGGDLEEIFKARKAEGFVRECHGDLHLANMAVVDDRITPFDCIEFDDQLRWIDVISEVAFVFMDLCHRDYAEFAHRFLNRYLQWTGDYRGIAVLRYYAAYRALVRAKVAILCARQGEASGEGRQQLWEAYRSYINMGERLINNANGVLLITHGVTGSGKSTGAAKLAEMLGAVCVRSDVERKRLFACRAGANTGSGFKAGIYTEQADRLTYARLENIATWLITAGYPVIVDATFLQHSFRARFRALANKHNVAFVILDFQAPPEMLQQRVSRRQARQEDVSDADLQVLAHQLDSIQALAEDELGDVIVVDAAGEMPVQRFCQLINQRRG